MVHGRVVAYDDALQPQISVTVHGKKDAAATIDAVVDTGFTEYLTLSEDLVRRLGLDLISIRQFTLANGAVQDFETYTATVEWDGVQRQVEIHCSQGDPLIGMAMLRNHDLQIRVIPNGPVAIDAID